MTEQWVEPDILDQVVIYVREMARHSRLSQQWFVKRLGIQMSKYQDWSKRFGYPNFHNGNNPRRCRSMARLLMGWIFPWEKEAILEYCRERISEGYRCLSYQMIDADIATVSPATVYRILKANGMLYRWNDQESSSKGNGFIQPKAPHEHWHIDIAYVKVMSILCS